MPVKQFGNLYSLKTIKKAFVVKNVYIFGQKKSHFEQKLACFELERKHDFFKRNFRSQSVYYTYQTSKKRNKNFGVICTLND